MGKKSSDIEKSIQDSVPEFLSYLDRNFDQDVKDFIQNIRSSTDVFLFSGVIRNFFLKVNEVRDVDLVVGSDHGIATIIPKYPYTINSFGGYKISLSRTKIDLWSIEKTWAFVHEQTLNYQLERVLHNTSFFNFAAIVFSFSENRFYYSEDFVKFLRDRVLDVVYTPNANIGLCVVNSLYYSDRFNLKISKKLQAVVKAFHARFAQDYLSIQLKHFGKVLYTDQEIDDRVKSIRINS